MNTRLPSTRPIVLAFALSLFGLAPLQAVASTASDLRYLVNRPSADAARELQQRGYQDVYVEQSSERNWHNWWNADAQDCLVASEQNGRYVAFQPTLPGDCTSHLESASSSKAGLVVAASAAALIGAIAIANHNKHKQQKEEHQRDEQYQRGYDDGLAGRYGHNDDHTDEYRNGFNDGLRERNDNGYARRDDHGSRRGHFVDVSDLAGARAASGESALQDRGFYSIDGQKGWHRSYTSWWNPSARECVQVVTRNGRYDQVNVVSPGACG